MSQKRIYICSPYRGNVERNTALAERLCWLAIEAGHVPFAPHLLYTRFLDDDDERERNIGISCGLSLMEVCDEVWYCDDYGISFGMRRELERAEDLDLPCVMMEVDE